MGARMLAGRAYRRSGSGLDRRRRGVFLVADLLAPVGGGMVVVDLVEREVDHEAAGAGAVPVLLAGLEEDPITRADQLDRPATALAETDALGDVDRLAERVGVPGGPGAGREVDEVGLHPRRRR